VIDCDLLLTGGSVVAVDGLAETIPLVEG